MAMSTCLLPFILLASSSGSSSSSPILDLPIELVVRLSDRSVPVTLEEHRLGGAIDRRRLSGTHLQPGEGSVAARLTVGRGDIPGQDAAALEGGVAAGPYWIAQTCILTNTDPLVSAVLGCTYTLAVNDPSITLGGGLADGMIVDVTVLTGAQLAQVSFGGIVEMAIDGNVVASLFDAPFSVSSAVASLSLMGNQNWGQPIPSTFIPAPGTDMSVKVEAVVSPGDTATISVFFLIN